MTHGRRSLRLAFACGAAVALAGCSMPNRALTEDASAPADRPAGDASPRPGVIERENWSFGGVKGQVIRTEHYRLFTTEKNPVIVSRLSDFLEYALSHYRTAIVDLPSPEIKLDTYLMDNRGQWATLTKALMGEQAETLTKIQRGGFASRGIGVYYDLGLFDTLAIAAHEGWHQYTQRTFRDPLPIWLEEGLATYMEGHRWSGSAPTFRPWANLERFDQLRKAHAGGKVMPLDELLQSQPAGLIQAVGDQQLLTYYAQVWALAHFLAEGADGRHRVELQRLLRDASEGKVRDALTARVGARGAANALSTRVGPAVFDAYFGDPTSEIASEYRAFIERLVASGGRSAVAAGRSPLSAEGRQAVGTGASGR
ncbi:MAG: DUF1570 domain-containing protein [Phycisphaerales bacterium]|nr:DUF1570 domain-containing protein [Phycisphaerales bacterium]